MVQTVGYPYNGLLFSNEKEWTYNMDKYQKYYALQISLIHPYFMILLI